VGVSDPPPIIEVTATDAAEFITCLSETLQQMTVTEREEVRLVVQQRQAVAISWNADYEPFLGYTAGFNEPDSRTAMHRSGFVLNEIGKWLRRRRRSKPRGGRVFITSDVAFTVPYDMPITLCKWTWPRQDLVYEVLSMLEESLFW